MEGISCNDCGGDGGLLVPGLRGIASSRSFVAAVPIAASKSIPEKQFTWMKDQKGIRIEEGVREFRRSENGCKRIRSRMPIASN
jgi:hypothetical protein